MSLTWYELIIKPRIGLDPEWLSDCMSLAGACAVTLSDDADEPILEPPIGSMPLWSKTRLTGLFLSETDRDAALLLLTQQCPPQSFDVTQHELADQDWVRAWMDQFKPMPMGDRLWICPSWEIPPKPDAVNIILDPGLAFGSGTHPTTSLICHWLDQADLRGKTVVDFGCGSGILAVAAAKLGAKRVLATDIDPQAWIATRENAERNHVQIELFEPDAVIEGVDLILANILAQPLIDLEEHFADLLRDGGEIVLSGILQSQVAAVSQAYAKHFVCASPIMKENWALLSAIRRLPF